METNMLWLLMGVAGAGTFLTRISFIQLLSGKTLPTAFTRLLRFVPPAVLSALILPAILVQDGSLHLSIENGRIAGALAASIVAAFTRNTILILAAGMGVLWLHQWVFL